MQATVTKPKKQIKENILTFRASDSLVQKLNSFPEKRSDIIRAALDMYLEARVNAF